MKKVQRRERERERERERDQARTRGIARRSTSVWKCKTWARRRRRRSGGYKIQTSGMAFALWIRRFTNIVDDREEAASQPNSQSLSSSSSSSFAQNSPDQI